ncbi:amidohydrolase family protein [uncultured Corynebacterium sp.]|uniref:N-acetylglucosamine-6-phosphate deacetylase n=1 Tax=uncultured Corynebacterium sp. TaxID=159447 RepID=UPI002600D399|nr:amidohydrolase family protein [uncultured Corynebacterium sp.]
MTTILEGRFVTATEDLPNARIAVDESGIITAVEPLSGRGETLWVPGFVDLHNHGGRGGAFPTGSTEDCRRAALYHRENGTTTLLASTVSANEEELLRQIERLRPLVAEGLIAGVHLEGPFVSPHKCGAQNPDRVSPGDPDLFARLLDAAEGDILSMTFAPETAHVRELLTLCARHGVLASLGHTAADAATTAQALQLAAEVGAAVTATHLFNAMPPVHHRAPGAAAALIAAGRGGTAGLELVADGVHLADATVDMVAAGPNSAAFAVTDAMEAAGMADGDYVLGALDVVVSEGVARLRTVDGSPGAIAGGTSTLREQFLRFRARHGTQAAVAFTSANAARVLRQVTHVPTPEVGQPARLVGLDTAGRVTQVIAH